MAAGPKLHPFKILAACLFVEHHSISRYISADAVHVRVRSNQLRRLLCLNCTRLISYLGWLADRGYVRNFARVRRGEYGFEVPHARRWNWLSAPEVTPNA